MRSPNNPQQPSQPALPVALPVAWSTDPVNPQVNRLFDSSTETNRTSSSTPSPVAGPRHQVGRRQLHRLQASLSDRDREVINLIAAHRYLTTRQVEAFCFHDHASPVSGARSARRVLRRLQGQGLLKPLERRVGGIRAGSASYVWQLGSVGHRLLRAGSNAKRTHEPSPRFLAHCLAVADAHLTLLTAQRNGHVRSVFVECEPECWRPFTGPSGERRVLQPDLFLITKQDDYLDRWFIEVDLGTESINTLLRKCAQYEDYRRTGVECCPSFILQMKASLVLPMGGVWEGPARWSRTGPWSAR